MAGAFEGQRLVLGAAHETLRAAGFIILAVKEPEAELGFEHAQRRPVEVGIGD